MLSAAAWRDVDRTVETARLLLRPIKPEDATAYAAIREKPEGLRHLPGGEARVLTAAADAERMTTLLASLWNEVGSIGGCRPRDRRVARPYRSSALPDLEGETGVLYMLDSAAWGMGSRPRGRWPHATTRSIVSGSCA